MPQSEEKQSLDHQVKELLADIIGLSCPIRAEDSIYEDLAADSLDLVEICVEIHTRFGFEADKDRADKWKTVGDIIRYVRGKLPITFSQDEVDLIVVRAKKLGAGPGLAFKMGQFKLSNYAPPHDASVLAQLIVGGWEDKWDLIHATQALIEFMNERGGAK